MKVFSAWPLGPLVAAGAAATLVAISILPYGPGLSPDSASYIAGARHLANGAGYVGYTGDPIVLFPPGFSLVVAFGLLLGFDATVTAAWANVGFVAGAAFLSGYVIDRVVMTVGLKWLSLSLVVLSVPMLSVSTMVWSETLFILLTMACLVVLGKARGSVRLLSVAGLLSGLAMATRYIGITVIAAGLLWLWFADRRRRIARSLWFLGPAAIVVISLFARNYAVTGSVGGNRPDAANSLQTNLKFLLASLEQWFVPDAVPLALGVLILAPIGAYLLWRGVGSRFWRRTPRALVEPFGLFIAVYMVTLIALELLINVDPPTVRFLSPIYLPLVIVGSAALDTIWRDEPLRHHRWAPVLVTALLVLGATVSVTDLLLSNLASGPGGYSSPEWRESEMVALVDAQADAWRSEFSRIYSNSPSAAYLLSDLATTATASKTIRLSTEPGLPRESMCPRGSSEALLIWYQSQPPRPHQYTPEEIMQVCELKLLAETSDGGAYVVTARR